MGKATYANQSMLFLLSVLVSIFSYLVIYIKMKQTNVLIKD